jgi:hypothetical protein
MMTNSARRTNPGQPCCRSMLPAAGSDSPPALLISRVQRPHTHSCQGGLKADRGLRALAVAATGGVGWATASAAGAGGTAGHTLVSTVGSGCSHLRRRVPNCRGYM